MQNTCYLRLTYLIHKTDDKTFRNVELDGNDFTLLENKGISYILLFAKPQVNRNLVYKVFINLIRIQLQISQFSYSTSSLMFSTQTIS